MQQIKPGEHYRAALGWYEVHVEVLAVRADYRRRTWDPASRTWVEQLKPHGVLVRVAEAREDGRGPAAGKERVVTAREIKQPWAEYLQERELAQRRMQVEREAQQRAEEVARERAQRLQQRLADLGWAEELQWQGEGGWGIPTHVRLSAEQLEQLLNLLAPQGPSARGLSALLED